MWQAFPKLLLTYSQIQFYFVTVIPKFSKDLLDIFNHDFVLHFGDASRLIFLLVSLELHGPP